MIKFPRLLIPIYICILVHNSVQVLPCSVRSDEKAVVNKAHILCLIHSFCVHRDLLRLGSVVLFLTNDILFFLTLQNIKTLILCIQSDKALCMLYAVVYI